MKCPKCGRELAAENKFCGFCGNEVKENIPVAKDDEKIFKNRRKKLIGAVIGVMAVGAVIGFVGIAMKGSSRTNNILKQHVSKNANENQLAYEKDGSLYYIENMDESGNEIMIYEGEYTDCEFCIQFSPDSRYLFFTNDECGTLFRVDTQEIIENEKTNENMCCQIDTDVEYYNPVGSDAVVYYKNGPSYSEKELYFANGQTTMNIDQCEELIACNDHQVMYEKRNDDREKDVYFAEFGEKPEVLVSNVWSVESADIETKDIYFTRKPEDALTQYDMVDDPYGDEGTEISDVDVNAYLHEISPTDVLSDDDYEYYQDDPEDFYKNECILDEKTGMYAMGLEGTAYDVLSDDDCIYYVDSDTGTWYKLIGWEYDEARSDNDEVNVRKRLRKNLMNYVFWLYPDDLYLYTTRSGEKEITSSVWVTFADVKNRICVYQKVDEDFSEKVCSIDDLNGEERKFYDFVQEKYDTKGFPYYTYCREQEEPLKENMENVEDISLSGDGKMMAISSQNDDYTEGNIYVYEVNSGQLTIKDNMDQLIQNGTWSGETFCYRENGGGLYAYSKGTSKKLVDSAVEQYIFLNDSRVIYIKDGELYIYRGEGKNIRIDSDVNAFGCAAE